MDIKKMTYESVSGGTFTIYTEQDKKLLPKEINAPESLNDFNDLLVKRIGEPIDNITFQIDESQHLSEERVIVNYKIDPDTNRASKTILTVSNMNAYEKIRYDQIKSELGI